MAKEVEKKVVEATDSGAREPIKSPEETVSLKKFKTIWNERQGFKDDVAIKEAELSNISEKLKESTLKVKEYQGYKIKLDEWNADRLKERSDKWVEDSKILDSKEGDKNFERVSKIRSKFAFSTEETPLTNEQLEKNFELIGIYNDANYFEVENTTTENLNNAKPTPKPTVGKGKYFGYETPEKLASADYKLAEKYKKENGGHW